MNKKVAILTENQPNQSKLTLIKSMCKRLLSLTNA